VEQAVRVGIEKGITTRDIGGTSSTREVGDAVAETLERLFEDVKQ
jgi:3-isopropylmalate dehydrogenase